MTSGGGGVFDRLAARVTEEPRPTLALRRIPFEDSPTGRSPATDLATEAGTTSSPPAPVRTPPSLRDGVEPAQPPPAAAVATPADHAPPDGTEPADGSTSPGRSGLRPPPTTPPVEALRPTTPSSPGADPPPEDAQGPTDPAATPAASVTRPRVPEAPHPDEPRPAAAPPPRSRPRATPTAPSATPRPATPTAAMTVPPTAAPAPAPAPALSPEELVRDHLAPALVDLGAITRAEGESAVPIGTTGPGGPARHRSPARAGAEHRLGIALPDAAVPSGPEVHVHIDRVEVVRPEPAAPPTPPPTRPRPDHSAYLSRQSGRWDR